MGALENISRKFNFWQQTDKTIICDSNPDFKHYPVRFLTMGSLKYFFQVLKS